MTILPVGNVGIGTTTPNAILDVATTTSGQSATSFRATPPPIAHRSA